MPVKVAGRSVEEVTEADRPPGDRIPERITRYLASNEITIRHPGGFNHYTVANHFASNPLKTLDKASRARVEELFKAVNPLFSSPAE